MNKNDIRICFVGDSFVNGTCDPQGLGWVGRLMASSQSDKYELTYYNLGIRGETSAMILSRWEEECGRRLPQDTDKRIVFSFGVNDTSMEGDRPRLDAEISLCNTRTILSAAIASYKVLMIGPPPVDDEAQNLRIRQLDSAFASLCREMDVAYLSIFAPLKKQADWMEEVASNDGSHPGATGYQRLAGLVRDWSGWWF